MSTIIGQLGRLPECENDELAEAYVTSTPDARAKRFMIAKTFTRKII
jgi:hypothetical protein